MNSIVVYGNPSSNQNKSGVASRTSPPPTSQTSRRNKRINKDYSDPGAANVPLKEAKLECSSNRYPPLHKLPPEILLYIFVYCKPHDIPNLRSVCKLMSKIIDDASTKVKGVLLPKVRYNSLTVAVLPVEGYTITLKRWKDREDLDEGIKSGCPVSPGGFGLSRRLDLNNNTGNDRKRSSLSRSTSRDGTVFTMTERMPKDEMRQLFNYFRLIDADRLEIQSMAGVQGGADGGWMDRFAAINFTDSGGAGPPKFLELDGIQLCLDNLLQIIRSWYDACPKPTNGDKQTKDNDTPEDKIVYRIDNCQGSVSTEFNPSFWMHYTEQKNPASVAVDADVQKKMEAVGMSETKGVMETCFDGVERESNLSRLSLVRPGDGAELLINVQSSKIPNGHLQIQSSGPHQDVGT